MPPAKDKKRVSPAASASLFYLTKKKSFKSSPIGQRSAAQVGGGEEGDNAAAEYEAWLKSRQLLKPDDQLELNEADLVDIVTIVLTCGMTNFLENLVVYSFKKGEFITLPPPPNIFLIHSFEGTSVHLDSEEAKRQIAELGEEAFFMPPLKGLTGEAAGKEESVDVDLDEEGFGEEGFGEGEEEMGEEMEEFEEEETVAASKPAGGGRKKKLINSFNYCERAALSYTLPIRQSGTQTIPPPRSVYGATTLQWVIFDSYAADYAIQQALEEKDKKPPPPLKKGATKKKGKSQEAEELTLKYLKCWQILERMINQNIFDDIAHDYRYWEDPSDDYRDGEGTLLPLWKFSYDKVKKMNVTDVQFNPQYYDFFTVVYGSHDFMKQPSEGGICLFTLKNPSFPDYIIMTESGVMCCDVHRKYPFLLAIGMNDGNVAVYNLQDYPKGPLFMSYGATSKHLECVSALKWAPDMVDGEINFFTTSSDGTVRQWILMAHQFDVAIIMNLYVDEKPLSGPDGIELRPTAAGTAITFHPTEPDVYYIGTEEGNIYKCSTSYNSKYMMVYPGHYQSVYRIDFNAFNTNIFVSCSCDWRIKVWEDMRSDPLFIFDIGSAVGDVKWAPYSSTVFAAVTAEGKVYVFDLNVNKYGPICSQALVPRRKNKLTRLEFNYKLPFLIVGDEKGTVHSVKLSPNLRVMCKPPKKQQWLDQKTMQVQKLDKILSLARELPSGEDFEEEQQSANS